MATLKRLWATASPEELLLALPERTWSAIRGARKGQQLPGRWGRWEPCRLPAWAEAGYCAADVTILDQYELQLGCPKLVEISGSNSIDETPFPSHPHR